MDQAVVVTNDIQQCCENSVLVRLQGVLQIHVIIYKSSSALRMGMAIAENLKKINAKYILQTLICKYNIKVISFANKVLLNVV